MSWKNESTPNFQKQQQPRRGVAQRAAQRGARARRRVCHALSRTKARTATGTGLRAPPKNRKTSFQQTEQLIIETRRKKTCNRSHPSPRCPSPCGAAQRGAAMRGDEAHHRRKKTCNSSLTFISGEPDYSQLRCATKNIHKL